jgi:lysozyme
VRIKAKLAILVALFLLASICWMVFNNPAKINNQYTDFGSNIPQSYPVLGIDVSHYQGDINWEQVSLMNINDDSVQFAYIKATEGLSIIDVKMPKNVEGASKNGIACGVYHYFIPTLSAKDQADFFVDETFDHNYSLVPALDIETNGDLSSTQIRDSVAVFLNRVEERIKIRPIIYTYFNFFESHFNGVLICEKEIFWIAHYSSSCPAMKQEQVKAWQFSEIGTIDGINEEVDLNIAKDDFLKLVRIKE